ncbi:MAG: carbohydrate kinase family protein [Candidatus Nealsonbacteria bacterium]|nr:carbohydrate kinase family protein [Candidatus Nealsonbacteria bacterium]
MFFDVITFGSSTWDIFIRDKEISSSKSSSFLTNKGICFSLGSKIDIDELHFFSGGGGSNSAATFLSLGFKTAYCGMVGDDPAGEEIIQEMKRKGADTSFIIKNKKKPTNHSFVLSIPGKDRTILTYRGASDEFSLKEIPFGKLKSKWFYLAPLSGKTCYAFSKIVDFAHSRGIRVAANPGTSQLSLPKNKLRNILKKVDILFLNKEEASMLVGVSYNNEKEILKKMAEFYSGTFVMTKGSKGLVVIDGKYSYTVGIAKSKVVDRTGAGDSFGSGLLAGIMLKNDIEYAIQLGSANASSCLREWGAKNGLLKRGERFKKIKIEKNEIN